MKPKDLLSQLSFMEQSLHEFSFEELTSKEAIQLKSTFDIFKKKVESKIFQPSASISSVSETEPTESKKNEFTVQSNSGFTDSARLIANVSHEIRTPLNGIIGFADLLKEDEELNPLQLEKVNAIQKASYCLMDIINELLEYSKLSAGIETFESIPFNFRNLLGDVVYMCKTLLSDKQVNLNLSIDVNVPVLLIGDPSKLTQILLNLIGNAIKFIEEGSIDLTVSARKIKENHTVLNFTVTDTGIGILEEKLKHIFDSFKQAESTIFTKYGGSGLGLNIVKRIIEQLGGSITVTSEFGVGTTFEFSIPFEVSGTEIAVRNEKIQVDPSSGQQNILAGMNILIFEDNLLNQKLIVERLKSWGCVTFITDNAQDGLDILSKHNIDMVLMDLKMPVMNGFEITKLIRSLEKPNTSSIPIIALSADFSARDKEQCFATGFNDFILKPFNAEQLLQKLIENRTAMNKNVTTNTQVITPKIITADHEEIDLSSMFDDCMGQVDLLEELISLYKQNALEFMGKLKIHIENSDNQQIAFAAHKIKSGLKMLNSTRLLKIVELIEDACNSSADMKQLSTLYSRFHQAYPIVEASIDKALNKLKE